MYFRRFRGAETIEIPSTGEKEAKRNSTPFRNLKNESFFNDDGAMVTIDIYDVFSENMISMRHVRVSSLKNPCELTPTKRNSKQLFALD